MIAHLASAGHATDASAAHAGPHALITPALEWVVAGINVVGAAVLIWAVLCGTMQLVRIELRRQAGEQWAGQRSELRRSVGFYLVFALELLIAADIIETMIRPDLRSLGVLGAVVILRVVISFTLSWELKHEQIAHAKEGNHADT